jgi:hypothetical protein
MVASSLPGRTCGGGRVKADADVVVERYAGQNRRQALL